MGYTKSMPVVIDINELELIRDQLVDDEIDGKREVPAIIHQIYWDFKTGDTTIPDKWRESKEAWINYHPNAIYVQWTGTMIRSLIARHYSFFLQQYDDYYHHIQRVDAGRTFILHRYGGIYCDMDLVPNNNVWNLFNGREDLYIVNDSGRYTNMLLASPPLSPFWPFFWQSLQSPDIPFWAFSHHFYIQASTGPLLIDGVVKRYNGTIGLLPGPYIQPCTACDPRPCTKPNAYFTMLQGGSWNQLDTKCVELFACHWPIVITIIIIIILTVIAWYLLHKHTQST